MAYLSEIERAVMLAQMIYDHPDGIVGGPLHIVLDDGNVSDEDIRFCIIQIFKEGVFNELTLACLTCAYILLSLSKIDRRFVVEEHYDVYSRGTDRKPAKDAVFALCPISPILGGGCQKVVSFKCPRCLKVYGRLDWAVMGIGFDSIKDGFECETCGQKICFEEKIEGVTMS